MITPEHNVQYKYDPLGRRIGKTVDGTVQRYLYDGQDIIADLDATGKPVNTYTNGPGIDEPLIMAKADKTNYFYHADALGNITAITDDTNQIIETYKYKAYGQPTIKNAQGQLINSSTIGNTRMFTAREYEAETGLYYYRARYMDPARGAFTQEDPIKFKGGSLNLFGYVNNVPTKYIDATGMDAVIYNTDLLHLGLRIDNGTDSDGNPQYKYAEFYANPGNLKDLLKNVVPFIGGGGEISVSDTPPGTGLYHWDTFVRIKQSPSEDRRMISRVEDLQKLADKGALKYNIFSLYKSRNCWTILWDFFSQKKEAPACNN
ncbi:MAG: hypothetical protein AUJ51_08505 [Elusimicrobia bacterium CG1_02_56_21]|nr:MAG: hypothetical protein AUJ51_08505 [Elusimicrobia bacterium CG1_02_56_21]